MNQTVENEKLASYSPEGAGWLPLNVGGLFNPLVVRGLDDEIRKVVVWLGSLSCELFGGLVGSAGASQRKKNVNLTCDPRTFKVQSV